MGWRGTRENAPASMLDWRNGSAARLHREGSGFDSLVGHHLSVVQRIRTWVYGTQGAGSIPAGETKLGWPEGRAPC